MIYSTKGLTDYLKITLCVIALVFLKTSFSQQLVNHNVSFNSGQQNMWGPSFSPFTIDQEITLFEQGWDVSFNTGSSGIVSIAGQSFGGGLSGAFSGVIGSAVRIEGFTTGTIEVDYPIDIELNMPNDLSYDQGDNVTIASSYDCLNNWKLETLYPTAGEFFWDFYFQMAASASAQLCFFGCVTFPIIPSFDTGLQTLNILTISGSGASTNGENGIWCLGPGALPPYVGGTEPPAGNWPYALPPEEDPTTSPYPNFIPWQVYYGSEFPIELPSALGLSGSITIPYVNTDPTINSNGDINACGDSTYFNLNLEIFDLLGGIMSSVPGPTAAIGAFLENLSGSEEIGGVAEVSWNFFSASFDANITNKQCFDFTPKVYAEMDFPLPVNYSIINGSSGAVSSTGQSSIITFEVGDQLQYQYPCYYEELNITPTYSIVGDIKNRTYDEVSFDFLMSAFEFGFEIPEVVVIPGFTIPEICIPIPYPCPSWSCPWCWCTYTACTPEVVVPDLGFPGFELSVGPLWETSIPIGSFQYNWFEDDWELEGFDPVTMPSFKMKASPIQVNSSVNDVACYEDATGSIDVTIVAESHAFPYSFQWSNGNTFTSSSATTALSNIEAGQYTVDIIDNNGCQLFSGATVNEPAELYLSYSKLDKQCGGGINNGSIDLSVFGGTPPYFYNWSNGSVVQDLSNLNSGTYSVSVTDSKGCTANAEVVIIEPNPIVVNGLITNVNCKGESDGEIEVSVYGGNLPFSFSWDSGQVTEDLSSLIAGTYTLTVTDAKNCTNQTPFVVDEPLQELGLSAAPVDINCFGENTGEVQVTTLGGTPGYTYQWVSPINGVLPYFSEDLNGIYAGEYILNTTDENGCIASINVNVDQPLQPISIDVDISNVLCFGESSGYIHPNVYGGTANYIFSWSNGSVIEDLNALDAGDYTLSVLDAAGCMQDFSFFVDEPDAELTGTVEVTNVSCFGELTGSISMLGSGGSEPYSYQLNTVDTSSFINELPSGTYAIEILDENLCSYIETVSINQPVAPINGIDTIEDVNCYGDSTGQIDVVVSGGTSPYQYTWVSSDSIIMTNTSQVLTSLIEGTYVLQIQDSMLCSQWYSYNVIQPSAPVTVEVNSSHVNCLGQSDGQIDLIVSGGSGNYYFQWNTGQVSSNLNAINAGIYSCNITDDNNCLTNVGVEINEPAEGLMLTVLKQDLLCNGDSSGAISSLVQGGTPPYTYAWSSGQTSASIDELSPGNYTLTVTDHLNCNAYSGALIAEPEELEVITNSSDVLCHGESTGSISINVTGGIQPYEYNWGDQNNTLLNNPSEILYGYSSGDYLIRVTDKNGCIDEQIAIIAEPELFVSEIDVLDVLCFGESNGSISVSFEGGVPPYAIQWNTGQTNVNVDNLIAGNYQYVALDSNNCRIQNTVSLNEPDPLSLNAETIPVSCVDHSDGEISVVIDGGIHPYSILWGIGLTDESINQLSGGEYTLNVTDYNNCSIDTIVILEIRNTSCIDIPNTFTPNGDNYNDTWTIVNINLYPDYELHVFNKWGNEVYNSKEFNQEEWDGTRSGNPLPSDVYYYILKLNNADDTQHNGTVTILR